MEDRNPGMHDGSRLWLPFLAIFFISIFKCGGHVPKFYKCVSTDAHWFAFEVGRQTTFRPRASAAAAVRVWNNHIHVGIAFLKIRCRSGSGIKPCWSPLKWVPVFLRPAFVCDSTSVSSSLRLIWSEFSYRYSSPYRISENGHLFWLGEHHLGIVST